jgi:hypothetical protein
MLKLQLTRDGAYDDEYLELPATPADVGEVMSQLDETSSNVASTRIYGTISDVWNIGRYLKRANVNDPDQLKKLNRIAEIVNTLVREQCLVFEGALDAESVNGLDDVIAIGERLEDYILVPEITTDRELGICLVESALSLSVKASGLIWTLGRSAPSITPITAARIFPAAMFSEKTARIRPCWILPSPIRLRSSAE